MATKKPNLTELLLQFKDLASQLEELTEDDEQAFNQLLDSIELKIDAYAVVNQILEAKVAAAEAELKAITEIYQKRLNRYLSQQKAFKARLKFLFDSGLLPSKMLGDQFYLSFRNYPVVDVKVAAEDLPERYQTIKVSPNKIALKEDLKSLSGQALEELKELAELTDNYSPQFGNK